MVRMYGTLSERALQMYESKIGCKDQESIQSSTTPDPGFVEISLTIINNFVRFVALRPKSTAMVMGDGQFTYPHFFLGKLEQAVNHYFVHIISLVTDNNPS